jgi:cytochrome P450
MATQATISFTDPAVQRCPFPAYAALREDGPVYWDEASQAWIVIGYDEVRSVALDPATYSSVTGRLLVTKRPYQDEVDAIYREHGVLPTNTLVVADPPLHTFHRALVDKVFTLSRVKQMRDYLSDVVNGLVDGVIDRGEVEFSGELATRIPIYIIADQLGMPRSEFARFKLWSDAVVAGNDPTNDLDTQLALTRTICEFHRFILDRAEEYRRAPADNMLSDLVRARDSDGRALDDRELASIVLIILVAGNDTTTATLSTGMYRLITTPGLEQALRGNPGAIANFIEEVLRYEAPIQGLWRRATRDTELGGVRLKEGDILSVRFGAANHDPAIFADPETLDPERRNVRNHLTFGAGPHFCVGKQLALAELQTSFGIVLDRMKNLRLARGEAGVDWATRYSGYGVTRLEMAFDRNQAG